MRTPHWIGIVTLALLIGAAFGYVLKPADDASRSADEAAVRSNG